MKKSIILLAMLNACVITGWAQSVFQQTFRNINGDSVAMRQYLGKKIMFIILPSTPGNPVYEQLTLFKNRYGDSIAIIGICSLEDGFQTQNGVAMTALYSSTGITLTEGINTRKAAGVSQSPLMQWLTDIKKNRHFNNDAEGVGQKFFISETGRLFAVMGASTSLQSPIIDRIVHSKPQ
jgi:glutathione peroxidase-family protein